MKRFLFSNLFIAFFLLPTVSEAAIGDPCPIDLTTGVAETDDWNSQYIIRGTDGSAWQRTILSRTDDILNISEGLATDIQGTGQPNSPVQLFLFAPQDMEGGGIRKPGSGTCFDAGITDGAGLFTFPLHARLIWGSIGSEIIIDAFTRMEQSWDQLKADPTNQRYFIGTHVLAKRLRVQVAEQRNDCPRLCTQSPYYIGSRIRPDLYPDVARGTFPLAQGKQRTGQDNNLTRQITIAKLAPHTFYTLAENDQPELAEILSGLADKAILVETIKRLLLGLEGGLGAPVGANFTQNNTPVVENAMETITEEALLAALSGKNVSPKIQQLVQSLHDAFIAPENTATRSDALDAILATVVSLIPNEPQNFNIPTKQTLSEAIPAGRQEAGWRADLIDTFMLWTEDTDSNTCLVPNNGQIAANFARAPTIFQNMPIPETNCAAEANTRFRNTWMSGVDPLVYINTKDPFSLKPKFTDMFMIRSNRIFDSEETWNFLTKDEPVVSYKYRQNTIFDAKSISDSCLQAGDVTNFAADLVAKTGLSDIAIEMIEKELGYNLPSRDGRLFTVSLIDPSLIAQKIDWEVNGSDVDLAQIFFDIKEDQCGETSFGEIPADVSATLLRNSGMGIEVGILQ